jgi:tetratricopeptide (TPR) repeat protein
MRILFAAIFAIVGSIGFAQQKPFPTTHLDYWGFVRWEDVGPTSKELERAVTLLNSGRHQEAYASFRDQWSRNPRDYKALHGLVLSAQRTSRLGEVIRMLDERIRRERQSNGEIPQPLVFAQQYAGKMSIYFRNQEGDKAAPREEEGDQWFYYQIYDRRMKPEQLRDPVMILLYANSLFGLIQHDRAREAGTVGVRMYPNFHGLKLFLACCYSRGSIARFEGGKQVPVPPGYRVDIPLYAKLAEEVVRDAPGFTVAYYETGMANRSLDKAKARRFLNRYLELEKSDRARIDSAKRALAALPRAP